MDNGANNDTSLFSNSWIFAGVLGLLICFAFPSIILGTESFVLRDFGLFGYPLAHYHKAAILNGEIPLWNPNNYCGIPFFAQWNTMVLYPGSLIYILFPLPWSLGIFMLLHQFLGGVGMYRLLKSWHSNGLPATVGAIAFCFGGLFQNCLMWPNNAAALGLLPWVILLSINALQRGGRSVPIAVLIGGIQMFTGAPEMILATWALATLIGISLVAGKTISPRDASIRFALTVVGVALLASPQLLPFFDLLSHSLRTTYETSANQWPADPLFFANMIIPTTAVEYFGSGMHFLRGQQWIHSYYTGIFILLLAFFALARGADLRHRLLGLLALFSCVLALGNDGYLYPLLDRILPLGILRYPVKFLVFPLVILPMLAAGAFAKYDAKKDPRAWAIAGGLVAAMSVVAFGIISWSGGSPEFQWQARYDGIMRFVWLGLGLASLWALSRSLPDKLRLLVQGVMILFLWLDLSTHQPVLTPSVLTELYQVENETLTALEPAPKPGDYRMLMSHQAREYSAQMSDDSLEQMFLEGRMSLSGNLNLSEGVPKFGGFFSLWFPKFAEVEQMIYLPNNQINERLADFLGIRYVTKTGTLNEWELRPTAQPWVTINPSARIEDLQFENQHITFKTHSSRSVAAMIAQFHYHPWKATIDGEAVEITPTDLGFQSISVPAGEHVVELRYVDSRFRLGLLLAFITLAGGCWYYLRTKPDEDASKS